jgi:hypothetical protein
MINQLIVSRYNEDTSWTKNFKNTIIYNKGNEIQSNHPVINLENVGREAHTYLHHIIENYDNLADVNCFMQGFPFDHLKIWFGMENDALGLHRFKKQYLEIPENHLMCNCALSINLNDCYKNHLEYDKNNLPQDSRHEIPIRNNEIWHDWWYSKIDPSKLVDIYKPTRMFWSALFSVRKEAILSNSKDYYKMLIKDLDHVHPIHAYYFESSWSYIFNIVDNFNMVDLGHNQIVD